MKGLILSVEAGHGHKKAAESVRDELKSRGFDFPVADALAKTREPFRNTYAALYFWMVVHAPGIWGWFFWLTGQHWIYPLISGLRSKWNWYQAHGLIDHLIQEQYDVLAFTHFFPAEVCAQLKRKGLIRSTLITVVTDVIAHPVWANPGTDFYWVMSDESKQGLLSWRVPEAKIHIGGIPIARAFSKRQNAAALRPTFGLKPDRFTVLFTSGSFGIGPTEQTLERFAKFDTQLQVIVVCGKNEALFNRLKVKKYSFPAAIFGFVNNMPDLMASSDIMIAKPGGATMCESLAQGIPMIIMGAIPGQETDNEEWLVKHRAGFRVRSVDDVIRTIEQALTQPQMMIEAKQGIARIAKPESARQLADFIIALKRSV